MLAHGDGKIVGRPLTDDPDWAIKVAFLDEIQVRRIVGRRLAHIHLRSFAKTLRRPVGIVKLLFFIQARGREYL